MLTLAVSLLNSPELRPASKYVPYFILLNPMLCFDLLDDVVKPDEAPDLHRDLLLRDDSTHIVTDLTRNVNCPSSHSWSMQHLHLYQRQFA